MQTGYSSKLRHMSKTQRVDMSFVTDCCNQCSVRPEYIESAKQEGDLLTKKHCAALDLVGLGCKICDTISV